MNETSFHSRRERSMSLSAKSLEIKRRAPEEGPLTFAVHKGIKSFSYCKEKLVILTGGLDRILRLWNPYVPKSPTATIRGHNAPIEMVEIDAVQNIFISIDLQKNIKIWNLGDQTLLTDVHSKSHLISKADIARAAYMFSSNNVIICTDSVFALSMKPKMDLTNSNNTKKSKPHISIRLQSGTNEAYTHKDHVTALVYNKNFDQIITCSSTSVIRVWNASTGELIFEFGGVETKNDGTEKNTAENTAVCEGHNGAEITSAILDDTSRRLITTGRDGNTCIWNPNSGECLTTLKTVGRKKREVHDCITVTINQRNKFICTVGWDKRIRLYSDLRKSDKSSGYKRVQHPEMSWVDDLENGHKDDIIGVAYCAPHLLASIDYDGNLFIWNLVSGHISKKILYIPKDKEGRSNKISGNSENPNLDDRPKSQDSGISSGSRQIIHSIVGFPKRHQVNESKISEQFSRPATRITQDYSIELDKKKNEPMAVLAIGTCDGYVTFFNNMETEPYASINIAKREKCENFISPSVTALKTSLDESVLICGDSDGFITIIDVRFFALNREPETRKPNVIKRWRAHVNAINEIEILLLNNRKIEKEQPADKKNIYAKKDDQDTFEDAYQLVTISDDKRARVWTFNGHFIGTFGQEKPWDSLITTTWQHPSTPEDVLFNSESLPKIDINAENGIDKKKYKDLCGEYFEAEAKGNTSENFKKTVLSNAKNNIKSKKVATNDEIDELIDEFPEKLTTLEGNNAGKHLRAIKMSKHREKVLNNPAPNDPAYVSMTSNAIFRKVLVFDLQDTPVENNNMSLEDFKSSAGNASAVTQQGSNNNNSNSHSISNKNELKLEDISEDQFDEITGQSLKNFQPKNHNKNEKDVSYIDDEFDNLERNKNNRYEKYGLDGSAKSRMVKFSF